MASPTKTKPPEVSIYVHSVNIVIKAKRRYINISLNDITFTQQTTFNDVLCDSIACLFMTLDEQVNSFFERHHDIQLSRRHHWSRRQRSRRPVMTTTTMKTWPCDHRCDDSDGDDGDDENCLIVVVYLWSFCFLHSDYRTMLLLFPLMLLLSRFVVSLFVYSGTRL